MAKVNGPLFSFGAAGKIADTLVYFNWKGINAIRSYVIPSNPRTTAQLLQRSFITVACMFWHKTYHNAIDRQAWANWATALAAVMTGFNAFCKHALAIQRLNLNWAEIRGYVYLVGTPVSITSSVEAHASTTGAKCWYGLSPTSMINSVVCTGGPAGWIATITGLTTKNKYFLQWEITGPAGYLGNKSGIYAERTT